MPRLPLLLFASIALVPLASRAQANITVAVRHVAVVDVEHGRVIADRDVLMRDARIVDVVAGGRGRIPPSARVIDGAELFVIPGLWDMHAHLNISADPARQELPLFVAHGVTGVRVMNTPFPRPALDRFRDLQSRIASGAVTGPRLLAIGTWIVNGASGIPNTAPTYFNAQSEDDGRQLARYFKENGYDFIKVYNNIPRAGYLGLASEARRLGIPFAGHEPATMSAIEISNAGQRSIEHSRIFLLNCFPAADSLRQDMLPGTATDDRRRMVDTYSPTMCAEVFRVFARNGTYITPTHVTRRMDAFADDSAYRHDPRMRYIPIRQRAAWLADADGMVASDPSPAGRTSFMDFYRKGLAITRDAYRAGVPLMLGTDAGDSFVFPGSSVHDELGELVKAGLSPAEALRAATLSGARFLGREEEFGTVQAGRAADLVLLDANPLADIANSRRIRAVIRDGKVFTRASLDSMLASVELAIRPDAQTRLWVAAVSGDTAEIARAIDEGARVDSLDAQGNRRPLNYAAANNRPAAIRVLLARGASLNLTNNTGFTAVHHAIESGSIAALAELLGARADLTIANTHGILPLETARRLRNATVLEMLQAAQRR